MLSLLGPEWSGFAANEGKSGQILPPQFYLNSGILPANKVGIGGWVVGIPVASC